MATKRKTYPGSIDHHGNGCRWRVSVGGKRHTYRFRTTHQKEAETLARSKYAELQKRAEREQAGLPGQVAVSALFDKFEREVVPTLSDGTQRSYEDSLKPIKTYFVDECGDPAVEKIRPGHIQGFLTWRRSRRVDGRDGNVGNRTLEKDRAALHRIFNLAERMEYRDGNPVSLTERPKWDARSPVILSDDQYEGLIKACDNRPMLQLYVLVLGETGARCKSEVMWIRWEDVDLEEGFLQIVTGRNGHRTKGGKSRWVPMTRRLRQALRDHFARYRFAQYDGQPSPWIFHHTISRRHHKAGARIRSLYDAFKTATKRAKLPADFVQHDLRHRRVTAWLADGQNPVHVKEAVGHADLRTTMAYTHLAREHLRTLVADSSRGTLAENLA